MRKRLENTSSTIQTEENSAEPIGNPPSSEAGTCAAYVKYGRRLVSHPSRYLSVDEHAALSPCAARKLGGKCVPCRIGLAQIESRCSTACWKERQPKPTLRERHSLKRTRFGRLCNRVLRLPKWPAHRSTRFPEDSRSHAEGRCLASSGPPCSLRSGLPANVDIPGYSALVSWPLRRRIELICKDNPFPSACAYVLRASPGKTPAVATLLLIPPSTSAARSVTPAITKRPTAPRGRTHR